jgi:hypothetical protein
MTIIMNPSPDTIVRQAEVEWARQGNLVRRAEQQLANARRRQNKALADLLLARSWFMDKNRDKYTDEQRFEARDRALLVASAIGCPSSSPAPNVDEICRATAVKFEEVRP